MKTKWCKNKYRLAIETAFDLARRYRSWRPLLALTGKKAWFETSGHRIYTSLVEYINFCRVNNFWMCFSGKEF